VLRTIDKCGGLDEYLLGEKPARIKELGMLGWSLRWKVMRTDWYNNKMREEVARMNLPPKVESHLLAELELSRGNARSTVTAQQLKEQIKEVDEQLGKSGKKEPEKEAEEERILFMAEQPPSSRLRASA
jgi:large subunit ribosomal protein L28